jgi:hypothetical protein
MLRSLMNHWTVSLICIQKHLKPIILMVNMCQNILLYFNVLVLFAVNTVWARFQNMFSTVNGIFSYVPTFKAYHRRLLEELYDDNVMYLAMRTGLSPVSCLNCF